MKRFAWWGYGFAVLVVAVTVLIKLALTVTINGETPFLLLFFAVLVSAWRGGVGPGLLATGLATLAADYFFIGPPYSFAVESIGQVVRLFLFVLEGTFTTFLVSALQSSSRRAEERSAEIDRYQENLKESEERYRLVIEGSNDGVWDWDIKGGGVYWNDRLFEILGLSRSEVEPSFDIFVDLIHPDDRQRTRDALTAHLERGERYEVEFRWRHASGEYRICLGRGKAQRDADGTPVRMTGTVQDITERKQRENFQRLMSEASSVLASSLDYQKTLASVARLAVPVLADWCAVDVVEEYGTVERLAVAHEDPEKVALARELQERYPQDPEAEHGVPRVLRTGEPELIPEIPEALLSSAARDEDHRALLRRLDLRSYMVVPLVARGRTLGAITMVMSASGRRYGQDDLEMAEDLAHRAAVAVDNAWLYREARREISDREKIEQVLRQSEALHRSVVDSAFDAMITMGADGLVRSFNQGAERVFGYASEEVVGQPMTMLMPERFREAHNAGLRRYLETGEARIVGKDVLELPGLRKGGEEVSLELSITEVSEAESPLFIGIARDVTERKRTEQALRQSEERYRAVIEQAAEGIILVDADGHRILEANTEFLRMFGYDSEEVAGLTVYDLVADDRESVDRNIEVTLEEGNRVVGERRYRCKDGSLLDVMVSGSAVTYGGRRAIGIVIRDITESKKAEEELRRSEHSLADAQRIAHMGNFEYDFQRDRARWSDELYRIFGWWAGEVAPRYKTFINAAHPDDRELLRDAIRKALRGEEDHVIEYRILRPNGELRYVETQYEVRREGTRPVELVGTVQDVTENRETERKLRDAETRFRTLVEQIPAITYIQTTADAENSKNVTYMSPQYEAIFGYSPEEEMYDPEHWAKILHPEDRERVLAEDARTDETGEPFKVEYRVFAKDGRLLWIRDEAVLVRDEDGTPLFWQGVQYDITEQKQAEEELRRSEERYRAVVEQAAEGIFLVDPDTKRFLEANAEYQRMLGYTSEELLGMTLYDVVAHDREDVDYNFQRSLEESAFVIGERRHRCKDGSLVYVMASSSLVFYGGRQVVCYVVHDITERKRFEEELEARAEELQKSNAELERFAYIASHDLQEPLRMVSSYTQLLARRYRGKLDQDADEFIEYAVDGATRMQTLINDLLTYSRVGTQGRELSPTDLSEVFAAARDNLKIAAEESGATVTSGELPAVMGDFTQLVQLFQNLIGNAIKFRGEEPPEIRVGAERRGRDWLLHVQDNGIGIDPQYAERVFVIFQRLHTREDYPGTGIGLAVSKRIVERHGGRMWIESEPGKGSTFFFTLPAMEGERR